MILDRDLKIIELSPQIDRFSDRPQDVTIGQDIRLGFPEFVGIEEILHEIFQGDRDHFELSEISKSHPTQDYSLYIDLHAKKISDDRDTKNQLLILMEETTDRMIVQQQLIQRSNEVNLISQAWSSSQAYLDQIIHSMADALLVTQSSGIIKKLNSASEEMFGYQEYELLNQPISILLKEPEQFPLPDREPLLPHRELCQDLEVTCKTKAGNEIIVAFSCTMIPSDFDDATDLVCIGKDMTNRVQSELKLRQALQKEKELNELKSRFIAMTSHELRTPLNTILFASELLRNATKEEIDELLEVIESNVKNLTDLVDYVSIVGKTEIDTIKLNKRSLDLVEFCRDFVSEIQLSLGPCSLFNFTSNNPCIQASVDRKILRHILMNLLSNAIASSSKTCHNEVLNFHLNQTDREIQLDIQTNGFPNDRATVLDSFQRDENMGDLPDTGLGLAIAQKYARLLGGRVELRDDSGVGNQFVVTIPRADAKDDR